MIPTWGVRTLTINLGVHRLFRWIFLIADTQYSFLGADFTQHFNLLVDIRNRRFIDGATLLSVSGKRTQLQSSRLSPLLLPPDSPYIDIMQEFPSLVRPCTFTNQMRHNEKHPIETTGHPVHE